MTSQSMRNVELDDDAWDEAAYPPPYSSTVEQVPQDRTIGFHKQYLFSVEGALKCIEIVLSLIGFIAIIAGSCVGSGFIAWVTISAFITTILIVILVSFNVNSRVHAYWPVYEFIYLLVYTLKYFIASIIAAVGIPFGPAVVTACAICFIALIVFVLDCVMAYRRLKASQEEQKHARASGEGGANRRTGNSFCIIF
ncbi:CKLF-like MARVEL transmembrane domain-containing protein 3 [Dreissena polymorpha]|uniref:MARVEL domain-containing protein n=1 Tax=Dreissena polymorpha TaxID=45954 RepID=A0A9D4DZB6_DREPO|nr:CKLF-like MARVEL transmembrane domain-containing protein 3 [Dreissena polymorpha]KAH3768962.1 hypothetical protein DPMN_170183 [Dreissena polymorpha]